MDLTSSTPSLCDTNLNLIQHIFLVNIQHLLEDNSQDSLFDLDKDNQQVLCFLKEFIKNLVDFYENNSDAVVRWTIHLISKSLRAIINRSNIEFDTEFWTFFNPLTDSCLSDFYLIIENNEKDNFLLSNEDVHYIYRNLNTFPNNENAQSLLTKLKNSFFNDSVRTSFVIDNFSRKYNSILGFDNNFVNIFDKIYLQSLIHALKNANQPLIFEILLRSNSSIFNDHKLNFQIISHLLQNSPRQPFLNDVYLELYTKSLFTNTSKLLELIYEYRKQNDNEALFTPDSDTIFNHRKSFLYAVEDKRHFLSEFYESYFQNRIICDEILPIKFRIIIDILYLQRSFQHSYNSVFSEKLSNFENELLKLFLTYESTIQDSEVDCAFSELIHKFRFVFRFSNWANQNLNNNKHDNNSFSYNIIASLLSGNSPLKILAAHGYLELQSNRINHEFYKENILCDELSALIEMYDSRESMLFKAFLALRLVLFSFFSNDGHDNFVNINQIKELLQDIQPILFRIEILEDVFQLLFLSRNDLISVTKIGYNSDGDNWNDTLTLKKEDLPADTSESGHRSYKRKHRPSEGQKNLFLCPNWMIPQLLEILKEILFKASSELYDSKNDCESFEFECNKYRLNQLMKYVADAQFRYDVIRPAFYKTILPSSKQDDKDNNSTEYKSFDENSTIDSIEINREGISTASSDIEGKNRIADWKTSLISCMLASKSQLLCYTLIENSIENALKIVQLFGDDLKDSKELRELKIIDYHSILNERISEIHLSNFITGNRIVEHSKNSSDELKNSMIQSLILEVLLKMDGIQNKTKKMFMIDFGISSSPSLEISQAIFESVGANNAALNFDISIDSKPFSSKVDRFVSKLQSIINQLKNYVHLGQLSFSDFIQKSIHYSSSLDAKLLGDNIIDENLMIKLYSEYQELTNKLENRIVDDPSIGKNDDDNDSIKNDTEKLLKAFQQIAEHCKGGKNYYLQTLFLYVCKVSKALGECRKRNLEVNKGNPQSELLNFFNSTSYFSILRQSPSAILCSMVIKSKISPKIIDDLAMNMKVNLMAVLCSVYCPSIYTSDLHDHEQRFAISELVHPCLYEIVDLYQKGIQHCDNKSISSTFVANFFAEEVDETFEKFTENSFQPLINQEVLNYFNNKCPILVELLHITGLINEEQLKDLSLVSGTKLHIYEDAPLLRWISLIKKYFFFGDSTATVSLALYPRILSSNAGVLKSLEHFAICQNYSQIYNMFKFINVMNSHSYSPENMSSSWDTIGKSFEMLQNAVYCRLALMQENARFIFHITNEPKVKCELVHHLVLTSNRYNETFKATRLVRLALQSILDDQTQIMVDVSEYKTCLEKLLSQIEFFSAVGQLTGLKSWKLAKDNLNGVDILTIIKTKKRFLLSVDWYKINGLEMDCFDLHIELLIHAFSEMNDYNSLRKLFQNILENIQSNDVIGVIERTLNFVENFELQSFLVELLIGFHRKKMNHSLVEAYEQHKMGIEMLKLINKKIREDYVKLVSQPVLLVEQLLMNCEIDSLRRICEHLKTLQIDSLLEKYAQKAVQLEIYDGSSNSGSDITSMSQLLNDSGSAKLPPIFIVPEKVPSKEQWISDASESHCMICRIVRFSMFNRRHHCRRCGRVVCQSCSANNFLIPEISPNTPVRVCNDCHSFLKQLDRKQSIITSHSGHSILSGTSFTVISDVENFIQKRTAWFLYPDEGSINESRRQEFAYECSPSVTLCLAILRLHSNKRRCCKFIIDKICAPLLDSVDSRNVDPTLLIEMIRSLLMSTKISVESERLIEQATITNPNGNARTDLRQNDIEQLNLYLDRLDVIRMLINCNYGTKQMIAFVLNNNIQKLQERLIEIERFELAIDIAKKYGFDSSSIWKTWAMICLKNGQFAEARRKFSRFFDHCTRTSDVQGTLRTVVDVLLQTQNFSFTQSNQSFTSAALKESCENIISGKFELTEFNPNSRHSSSQISALIMPEILHYLKSYGKIEELLKFYVKFGYWKEATNIFISNYSNETTGIQFLNEIFLPAQKRGAISTLFTAIRSIDPQLTSLWNCLIFVCKYLDKSQFYNSLYRMQLFMGDYLRAAITQINHFFLSNDIEYQEYRQEIGSYDELASRLVHLEKARDNCNMFLHNIEHIKQKSGCLRVDKKDVHKQIRLIEIQIDVLKRFRLKKVTFPIVGVDRSLSSLFVQFFDRVLFQKESLTLNDTFAKTTTTTSSISSSPSSSRVSAMRGDGVGAVNSPKLAPHPPTLLEHDASRKSYIAALIILHYDDSIEESFRFSLRIIQEHQLDSAAIYKIVVGLFIGNAIEKNLSNTSIINWLEQFLHCVRSCSPSNSVTDDRRTSTEPSFESDKDKMPTILNRLLATSPQVSPINGSSIKSSNLNNNTVSTSFMSGDMQTSSTLSSSISMGNDLCDEIVSNTLNAIKWTLDSAAANVTTGAANVIVSDSLNSQKITIPSIVRTQLSELNDLLVKLLSDDQTKIDTYLASRKLKLAYLLAVSSPKVDARNSVELVAQKARQINDQTYIKICELWLMKNAALNS